MVTKTQREDDGRRAIAFVINSLTAGGAERAFVTLLDRLSDRLACFETHLILLDDEPELHSYPSFVKKHVLSCNGSLWLSVWRLSAKLKELDPVITMSFINRSNYANVLASHFVNRPCVISQRNHTSDYFSLTGRGRFHRGLVRMLYPRANALIAVSRGVGDDLVKNFGIDPARLDVVYNVSNVEGINRLSDDPKPLNLPNGYFVGMGTLIGSKGFDFLIRAFAASDLDGSLVILGDGPERSRLEALARDVGLGNRVLMPGHLRNPYPILKGAKALISASLSEGYPNVIVEALALGRPVVASDCPAGPSEILEGEASDHGPSFGGFGILVRPADVGQLAEGLKMIESPEIATRYALTGPARAAYLEQNALENYWSILTNCMKDHVPGARSHSLA